MDDGLQESFSLDIAQLFGAKARYDLVCLGTSMFGLGAMTIDAILALASADMVFCYPPTPEHFAVIKQINSNSKDVFSMLYSKGKAFDSTYQSIIETVMDALRKGNRVAYATQGSPAFHCGTAVSLMHRAKKEGFSCTMIPGISSFELLSVELCTEYTLKSMQILSAFAVAERELSIDARMPCMLFDLTGYVSSGVQQELRESSSTKLDALIGALKETYPSEHSCILVQASNGFFKREDAIVETLDSAIRGFVGSPTVFFPAAELCSSIRQLERETVRRDV